MKNFIAVISLFFAVSTGCFSQKYSLKFFLGQQSDYEIQTFNVRSLIDTNDYEQELHYYTQIEPRFALGITGKSGHFTDISFSYARRGPFSIGYHSGNIMSDDTFVKVGTRKGNRFRLGVDVLNRIKNLETGRIKTYWGVGSDWLFEEGRIVPDPGTTVYAKNRQIFGVKMSLLGRLNYHFPKSPRLKIELAFGVNVANLNYNRQHSDNPNLPNSTSTNIDFDHSFRSFYRIGTSFTFGKNITEKT